MKSGSTSGKIALAQRVSRITVWKIWQVYRRYGYDGLRNHKSGRLFEPLNQKFYRLVVEEWRKQRCGARKLHAILQKRGFGASLRKVSQVLKAEGFQKPNRRKQKPRKYKRYEWPLPNFMWHTDWHVIKATKLTGKEFLCYLDDCSRKVMSYGVFDTPTTKASLLVLYKAIDQHLVTPFELNSDRGSQFIPSKHDKKGEANSVFQETLKELGILFVPSRTRHPQTNGKLEKFHHILDTEFDDRFETMGAFIEWYNSGRASEALDYSTPKEAYERRL